MPSEPATRMARIVAIVAPLLRERGFRRRRHVFNRRTAPGIVHVVDFQMGPYEPPGTPEIPPWRRNLYGQFTINAGVHIDEVAAGLLDRPGAAFVPERGCEIRARIGRLLSPPRDLWFRLDAEPVALDAEIVRLVMEVVLPFLDRLPDRRAILEAWSRGALEGLVPTRAPLSMAMIHRELGEVEAARGLVRDYLARSDLHPGHRAWAANRVRELGLA